MNRKTPMTKADDVRETPAKLFEQRNALYRFTLDACATHANAKCALYFTQRGFFERMASPDNPLRPYAVRDSALDGLTGPWIGRVWCNPPFSELWAWIAKCWQEVAAGNPELIDFLMPATRCEQDGWQRLVEPYRDGRAVLVPGWRLETDFLPGRQHFLKDGKPIVCEDPTSENFGKKSSPKFGCVMLTWTREG
jgi:hypothetical protein